MATAAQALALAQALAMRRGTRPSSKGIKRSPNQAKRMKDLERENVRLKRLVANLSLEKQVLKDVASGNL